MEVGDNVGMTNTLDVAVIGAGMIGSSAARWLARAGLKVAAVGPGEPLDWQKHSGVWASHYDQGRITRISDPSHTWGWLAARSIEQYAQIELESGIRFHYAVGQARITPDADAPGDSLKAAITVGQALGANMDLLDEAGLRARFPFLGIPQGARGLHEHAPAGYVNPRALVAAQLRGAALAGAQLIPQRVIDLESAAGGWRMRLADGSQLMSSRVLVTTGSFSNLLLGRKLKLDIMLRTVLMATLDADEQARLAALPSLIWRLDRHPVFKSFYSAAPTQYPDGSVRFKIGGEQWVPNMGTSEAELNAHFHSEGNVEEIAALHDVTAQILPGLRAAEWNTRPCVWCHSAHGNPYVDELEPGLYSAVGDAGASAKSCVEIGRMAALLAQHGRWQHPLPQADFAAVYA